jgi:hypothetical protein
MKICFEDDFARMPCNVEIITRSAALSFRMSMATTEVSF